MTQVIIQNILTFTIAFETGFLIGWLTMDWFFYQPQKKLLKSTMEEWGKTIELLTKMAQHQCGKEGVVSPIQVEREEK